MRFDIKMKTTITQVEIEAWMQDGKWFAAIPEEKLIISGSTLWEALDGLAVAVEAHLGLVVTQTMKMVWRYWRSN
jgi:hypothetical protein